VKRVERRRQNFFLPFTHEGEVLFQEVRRRRLGRSDDEIKDTLTDLARLTRRLAEVNLANLEAQDMDAMLPAQRFMHRRNLADATRMAAKDVYSMSSSELAKHRRRLKYGVRVSDVLAALMEEVEDHQYRYDN